MQANPESAMDEQDLTGKEYNEWLYNKKALGIWIRLLMSPGGLFIHNTQAGKLFTAVPIKPTDRILDIGGGYGSLLLYISRRMPAIEKMDCLDVSEAMVARAQKEIDRRGLTGTIIVTLGKATTLPYADQSMDVILCSYMIKHLSDESFRKMIAEAGRVLKPGGRLCLWEVGPSRHTWRTKMHTRLLSQEISMIRLRGEEEILRTLSQAGFTGMRPFGKGFYILCPFMPRVGFIGNKSQA